MIDFSQTFCDLHPHELISNFCCKEQCQVGLCASCICTHTEMHMLRRSAPEYQNIRTTYTQLQDRLRSQIAVIDQHKGRVTQLISNIQDKRQQVAGCVAQARHQALQLINGYFDEREQQLIRQIQANEKNTGLLSENRMQGLLNGLAREVNVLYQSATEINSKNFLENYQRINQQVLSDSLRTVAEVARELECNENYQAVVSISSNFIDGVRVWLEKSIQLSFGARTQRKSKEEIGGNSRLIAEERNSSENRFKRYGGSLQKSSFFAGGCSTSQLVNGSTVSCLPQSQSFIRKVTPTETIFINSSIPAALLNSSSMSSVSGVQQRNKREKGQKENTASSLRQSQIRGCQTENRLLNDSQCEHKRALKKSGLTIFKSIDSNQYRQRN